MKIKFLEDADTLNYGFVKKGEEIEVLLADGKAFIANGKAKKVKGDK